MAFTLEVAESEIQNMKIQVTDIKKSLDNVSMKIDDLEKEMSRTNIILTKLDSTLTETLNVVKCIVEKDGTNRCVERAGTISTLVKKVDYLENHPCASCKNEKRLYDLEIKQGSIYKFVYWIIGLTTTIGAGIAISIFSSLK